tara:strand:+ start:433 stop:879 length:447 start_codon:yes stop_codon:yes gene_type:complete
MSSLSRSLGNLGYQAISRISTVREQQSSERGDAFTSQQNDQNGQKTKYENARAVDLTTYTDAHVADLGVKDAAVEAAKTAFLTLVDAEDGLISVPELQAELTSKQNEIDAALVNYTTQANTLEADLRNGFGTADAASGSANLDAIVFA